MGGTFHESLTMAAGSGMKTGLSETCAGSHRFLRESRDIPFGRAIRLVW